MKKTVIAAIVAVVFAMLTLLPLTTFAASSYKNTACPSGYSKSAAYGSGPRRHHRHHHRHHHHATGPSIKVKL